MRVKIIGNAKYARDLKIVDADTGHLIQGISRLELIVDAQTNEYKAVLHIDRPILEIEAEINPEVNGYRI